MKNNGWGFTKEAVQTDLARIEKVAGLKENVLAAILAVLSFAGGYSAGNEYLRREKAEEISAYLATRDPWLAQDMIANPELYETRINTTIDEMLKDHASVERAVETNLGSSLQGQ